MTSSESVNCAITSYEIVESSSTGSGNEVTVDQSSGSIIASTGSSYSNNFKIKVCTRSSSAGDSNDCLTSTQIFTVVVTNQCVVLQRTTLPTSAESIYSNDFILNETVSEIMLYKTAYVNQLSTYQVNTALFFSNNCPLT